MWFSRLLATVLAEEGGAPAAVSWAGVALSVIGLVTILVNALIKKKEPEAADAPPPAWHAETQVSLARIEERLQHLQQKVESVRNRTKTVDEDRVLNYKELTDVVAHYRNATEREIRALRRYLSRLVTKGEVEMDDVRRALAELGKSVPQRRWPVGGADEEDTRPLPETETRP